MLLPNTDTPAREPWRGVPMPAPERLTAGQASLPSITGAAISIPGQGTWICDTNQTVSSGETIELFAEMYGDYALSFDKPGHRSSGSALIVLYGQHGELSVIAPVTSGELPTSYTGGRGGT